MLIDGNAVERGVGVVLFVFFFLLSSVVSRITRDGSGCPLESRAQRDRSAQDTEEHRKVSKVGIGTR